MVHPIKLTLFPQVLDSILGTYFCFFLNNLAALFFRSFYRKNTYFGGVLSIVYGRKEIERNQKNQAPQTVSSIYKANFSSIGRIAAEQWEDNGDYF
jgi:hypothetical protein